MRIFCRCGASGAETTGRAVGEYAIRYAGCFSCGRGFVYEWPRLGSGAITREFDTRTEARAEYARKLRDVRNTRRAVA